MQKQKLKTEKAPCGEDTMIFMKDKELEPGSGQRMKVWESLRQCTYNNERISAVKIEVLLNAKGLDWVKISEVKDGKLFGIKFNDSFEPIESEFPSGSETVELQRGKLIGFLNAAEESIWGKKEFFRHAMGREKVLTTTANVWHDKNRNRLQLYISREMALKMQLKPGMSGKWNQEGDSWVMTPLDETTFQGKIQKSTSSSSLCVVIPANMLFIAGLKLGDYVAWSKEESEFHIRKAEKGAQGAQKLFVVGHGTDTYSVGVAIPEDIVKRLKIENGMYALWTFDENGPWIKFERENPYITAISQMGDGMEFVVRLYKGSEELLGEVDEVTLRVENGKLYVKPKK